MENAPNSGNVTITCCKVMDSKTNVNKKYFFLSKRHFRQEIVLFPHLNKGDWINIQSLMQYFVAA